MASILKRDVRKLYFDRKHNFIWCPVYKAASTNMVKSLIELWRQEVVSKYFISKLICFHLTFQMHDLVGGRVPEQEQHPAGRFVANRRSQNKAGHF